MFQRFFGSSNDRKVKAMQAPKDSKEFAMKAAEGGMLEVKLSQLAQQKSQSQDIKRFAQQLEQDHSRANQELMAAAKQKNIDLPTDLKGECAETYQAFQVWEIFSLAQAFTPWNEKSKFVLASFRSQSEN